MNSYEEDFWKRTAQCWRVPDNTDDGMSRQEMSDARCRRLADACHANIGEVLVALPIYSYNETENDGEDDEFAAIWERKLQMEGCKS